MANTNQYVSKLSHHCSTSTSKCDITATTTSSKTRLRIKKKLLRDTHADDDAIELSGITARRLYQLLKKHYAGCSKTAKWVMVRRSDVKMLRAQARR